jgi:hypothetical protein
MRTLCFSILLLPLLIGCAPKETILSGTVTLDGQPLKDGYITFFPPEGSTATTLGTKVTNGQYIINPMIPGERRAVISATPEVQVQQSGNGPALLRFMPTAQMIFPLTQGNNRTIEIRRGKQTLDFELKNPQYTSGR